MKHFAFLVLPVAALLPFTGCSESMISEPAGDYEIAAKRGDAAGQQDQTILDVVLTLSDNGADSEFTILRDIAVGITNNTDVDLVAALSSEDDQFTVFAPTDQAFANLLGALGASSLDDVVAALGWDGLADVVLYHVVPGRRFARTVVMQKQMTTLNGATITKAKGGTVLNGSVNIVAADAAIASNGIVHVIDAVLLPPSE